MGWSRITFDGGLLSADCIWARTVFQQLYETAPKKQADALALYVAKGASKPTTLYLSALATERINAADMCLHLVTCKRPETETVDLLTGHPMAWHPEWCDCSHAERRSWEELDRLDYEHTVEELGMGGPMPQAT